MVISCSWKGDQPAGSLDVKAPLAGQPVRSVQGASKLADRSRCVNQEATKVIARVKRIAGVLGVPSRSTLGEGRVDIAALELTMIELPGVGEDGMPGQNG